MTQPTPYTISFSFTDWSTDYPSKPQPGVSLDNEFQAIKVTTDEVIANMAKIQRDDGALKNAIVTPDALSPATLVLLAASAHWTPRGAWVTNTAYARSDVINSGTQTLVCVTAHTSSADIATDIAAGDWLLIFDTAGSTPGDGTVTEPKFANGAVSSRALGFTYLDLSSYIRSGTGIQAGTGNPTGLMHAKLTTGDVYVTAERGAQDSGVVGYRWVGVGVTWTAVQASESDDLVFANATGGTAITLHKGNTTDAAGLMRSSGDSTASSGSGAGIYFKSGKGYLDSYNYDAAAWNDLKVRGLTLTLSGGGVDIVSITSSGFNVASGFAQRGGLDLGWLDLPQNVKSSAYTLALTDRGKHIYSANTAAQAITIPANATVAFHVGSAITIINDGSSSITLAAAAGVTLREAGAGTTGNRTLASRGLATLIKVGTNSWYVTGVGLL